MREEGDWTIVAAGIVFTGDEVIWYCISIYEVGEATLPLGRRALSLPTAA